MKLFRVYKIRGKPKPSSVHYLNILRSNLKRHHERRVTLSLSIQDEVRNRK